MRRRSLCFAAAILAASSCGFLRPRPDLTRWFVLATIEELEGQPAAEIGERSLGIGPLTFPEYVLRRELVSRDGTTGIVPFAHDRWAEPLEDAVARVLASDLAHLTGARTVQHPWFAANAPALRARVDFERFEVLERESAILEATWSLEEVESGKVLEERRSQFVRPFSAGHADAVGAVATVELSRALADISGEIAQGWKSLQTTGERSP